MRQMRSNFGRFLAVWVLSAFLCVLAVETFHHHDTGEDVNCSVCSFQQNASHSTPAPVFPHLVTTFRSFTYFQTVQVQPAFCATLIRQGRAPPPFLLS
jgi:hypothetical protein